MDTLIYSTLEKSFAKRFFINFLWPMFSVGVFLILMFVAPARPGFPFLFFIVFFIVLFVVLVFRNVKWSRRYLLKVNLKEDVLILDFMEGNTRRQRASKFAETQFNSSFTGGRGQVLKLTFWDELNGKLEFFEKSLMSKPHDFEDIVFNLNCHKQIK